MGSIICVQEGIPLGSMPMIDTPFKRVAVDNVGLAGHQ